MAREEDEKECLYQALGVEADAPQDAIKKAYYKLALRLHPDKNPGDEEAAGKFQRLQEIYGVLSDPERRKLYDETGEVSEDLAGADFDDLKAYFRARVNEITPEILDNFYDTFRGSDEERQEVLKYYKQFKGDMAHAMSFIMCSDEALDSHRFADIIEEEVEKGETKRYKAFKAWAKQVAATPRPKDPLRKRGKKTSGGASALAAGGEDSFAAAMVARRAEREMSANALFAALEAKYGGGAKRKAAKESAPVAEPSEEEFAAAQARLGIAPAGARDSASPKRSARRKKGRSDAARG